MIHDFLADRVVYSGDASRSRTTRTSADPLATWRIVSGFKISSLTDTYRSKTPVIWSVLWSYVTKGKGRFAVDDDGSSDDNESDGDDEEEDMNVDSDGSDMDQDDEDMGTRPSPGTSTTPGAASISPATPSTSDGAALDPRKRPPFEIASGLPSL